MSLISQFSSKLSELDRDNLKIQFHTIDSPIDSSIKIKGKKYLNFSSNNYLGLTNDRSVKKAAISAIKKYGIGPAAVRTISGTTYLHEKLEKKLADFKKCDDTVIHQSGYIANLATIPAIVDSGDLIFSDELNHASIIDGCRLSDAKVIRYNHCDVKDLENKLRLNRKRNVKKIIITDGVFSMDGDIAPLVQIEKIAKKHKAITYVDDAHGEGVLGKNGRGIVDHFNLHGKIDLEIGTMSKAFGVIGGYVAGNGKLIDWLRQKSRPFLFSSAMTIPDTAACIKAVELLEKSDRQVKKLWGNSIYFKQMLAQSGFDIGNSQTPITPLMLKDEKLTKIFSNNLFKNKLYATGITYPTVPLGKARIRFMVSASHSKRDLKKAIKIIIKVGKKLKVLN
jgi:glycine C-acetyltransferase